MEDFKKYCKQNREWLRGLLTGATAILMFAELYIAYLFLYNVGF
jgi:hypothetical protein